MPDATLKDFGEVAAKCAMGEFPLLPHPEWGQDAAYLAFMIDGLMARRNRLGELLLQVPAAVQTEQAYADWWKDVVDALVAQGIAVPRGDAPDH